MTVECLLECIAYTGYSWRRRCLVQSQTEMSCTVADGDVLYGRRQICVVWPKIVMSCMAGDGDVLYGRRCLMPLVRGDGIQLYWYVHIYTGLVAFLY